MTEPARPRTGGDVEPIVLPGAGQPPATALLELVAILRSGEGPLAVRADDLVLSPAALAPLTHDPYAPTGLLVRPAAQRADVRVRHHVVTSVGTGFHEVAAPDHVSVGALVVANADRSAVATLVADLAHAVDSGEVVDGRHGPHRARGGGDHARRGRPASHRHGRRAVVALPGGP